MNLNLQVVPYTLSSCPSWARIYVARPQPGDVTSPVSCHVCGGSGALPRRGDPCPRCAGSGTVDGIVALRADVPPDLERDATAMARDARAASARVQWTVRLAERGGGLTNRGSATIVAGVDGAPLASMGGRAVFGAEHAVFYAHVALVVVYSQSRGDGAGEIMKVGVDTSDSERVQVSRHTYWRFRDGEPDPEIAGDLEMYTRRSVAYPAAAVAAAYAKARDYHCRSAYYAIGGAAGQSGAMRGAGAAFGGQPSPLKGPGRGY
jgi:hypothetical protein